MYKIFMEESKKIEPTIVFWGGVGVLGFFLYFVFLYTSQAHVFIHQKEGSDKNIP